MKNEMVLCIETSLLSEKLSGCGFVPIDTDKMLDVLAPENLWLISRARIEENEDFRQVIPYVILTYGNDIVIYSRTSEGGEARLHDKISLGLGGHVNLFDAANALASSAAISELVTCAPDGEIIVDKAMSRELIEEVGFTRNMRNIRNECFLGFIFDGSDAVSRSHLGVVWRIELRERIELHSCSDIKDCQYVPIEQLIQYDSQMENWSRLCLDFLGT